MRSAALVWRALEPSRLARPAWDIARERVSERLDELSRDRDPPELTDAMRHLLLARGKRVRAILLLLALEGLRGDPIKALDTACAIEMLHAASLIVDDLPSMDDANSRRGYAATHIAYGEDRAILAAVALIAEAFRTVAGDGNIDPAQRAQLSGLMAGALGPAGLTGGQDKDLHALQFASTVADIEAVHRRKTGMLFALALESAAVIASADAAEQARHREAGHLIGLGFQCLDDLLDVYGQADELGKDTGQDGGKVTLARLLGREDALAHAEARVAQGVALLQEGFDAAGGTGPNPAVDYITSLTGGLMRRMVETKPPAR